MNNTDLIMEKHSIRENLEHYYFILNKGDERINSIYACIDNTGEKPKALLLDSAFPEQAALVKKDLESQGITVESIIISHYHPDHAGGCPVFPAVKVMAGYLYEHNYENCKRWRPDLTFIRPVLTFKNQSTFSFGTNFFQFIEAPGHSLCMMLIKINNDVLYISDLLMYAEDGRLSLPYISPGGSYKQYIATLETLKKMEFRTALVTHGKAIDDKTRLNEDIDKYIYYLKAVLNSEDQLPLASCLKGDQTGYANHNFHDNNLLLRMMEI